tara:strand:+ start:1157 stop:1471 length:315 start_codon:yes stop_codon:yes gene_type:complete
MEEDKPIKGQPRSFLKKLKENVDDHDEQMAILGAIVRLGVVVWSGFIITLNYVELPMVRKPLGASSDITFVASIFTGALATFGLSTGNGKKNGNGNGTTTKPKT